MTSSNPKEIKYGITHAGKFHGDETFTAALLQILNPEIQIQRTFKVAGGENPDPDIIVFDIGGGKFDHHQFDAEVRENGVQYAAFGLVWREFGPLLVSQKNVDTFDRCFVQAMDNTDNTGGLNPMSMAINSYMPNWNEDESDEIIDKKFFEAVDFAKSVLKRIIKQMKSEELGNDIVLAAYDEAVKIDSTIVVLDKFIPFNTVLIPSNAEFVVYPSLRGGWAAQAIKKSFNGIELKIPFPEKWRSIKELEQGKNKILPLGVSFCHASGFMIAADNKETAIHACGLAIAKDLI